MKQPDPRLIFEVFKEISIIEQLSSKQLEARLPDGVIAPHYAVLSYLSTRGNGATPITMARTFQVPKTSMTHTLKGLAERGYVAFGHNPKDRRSKTVWLTDAGRELYEDVIVALAPRFERLARTVDYDALAAMLPTLAALREYMESVSV